MCPNCSIWQLKSLNILEQPWPAISKENMTTPVSMEASAPDDDRPDLDVFAREEFLSTCYFM